jgi:DNA repair protein RadD
MVIGKTTRWLMDNKRLSDYEYYRGQAVADLSHIRVSNGDYVKKDVSEYMEGQNAVIGDCVTSYKKNCMGKLHIVRCTSIRHSEIVAQRFRDAGIVAMHVDGNTPMAERRRIFKSYAMREITVLTFCDLLNFGFDLSQASGMDVCIESGSDMRPSKSLAAQLQFWGRLLRMKDYPAVINDHVGNYREHGLPDSDREWTLEDRSQTKQVSVEATQATKQCPRCYHVHKPKPACPYCNHVYEVAGRQIDEVEGEMVKITPEQLEKEKKEKRMEQGRARSYEDLVSLGRMRKMKHPEIWAKKVLEARKGKRYG